MLQVKYKVITKLEFFLAHNTFNSMYITHDNVAKASRAKLQKKKYEKQDKNLRDRIKVLKNAFLEVDVLP